MMDWLFRESCQGIIRKEDVRQIEVRAGQRVSLSCMGRSRLTHACMSACLAGGQVDKVEVFKCFRPGDIVRARVISLGDARQYYLSTAENELGVSRGRGSW